MCRNVYCECENCRCEDCSCNVFTISVVEKTGRHPNFGKGSHRGFIVNGIEGGVLNLRRNVNYFIEYNDMSQRNPLYFTTSNVGILDGERLTPNITDPMIVRFDKSFPNLFFYQSTENSDMGGIVNLN